MSVAWDGGAQSVDAVDVGSSSSLLKTLAVATPHHLTSHMVSFGHQATVLCPLMDIMQQYFMHGSTKNSASDTEASLKFNEAAQVSNKLEIN